MLTFYLALFALWCLICHGSFPCADDSCSRYSSLLNNGSFLVQMSKQLSTDCDSKRLQSVAGVNYERCSTLEYLRNVIVIYNNLLNTKATGEIDVSEIELISETYAKVFQDYVIAGRPFKGKNDIPDSSENKSVTDLCDLSSMHDSIISSDKSLKSCTHLNIKTPKVITNNYLIRINNEIIPTNTPDSSTSTSIPLSGNANTDALFDYTTHWPSTKTLYPDTPTPAHSCPADLHMVLWGVEQQQHTVRVRITPKSHSMLLEPHLMDRPDILPHHIDGSNFRSFRTAMSLEAKVSPQALHILNTINSPSFDTSMLREPDDMDDLKSYRTYPRSSKIKKDGGGSRGNKFRVWQESNKWNLLISSLTMPEPPCPMLGEIGRRNVKLTWT
eukprot:gene5312-10623_t